MKLITTLTTVILLLFSFFSHAQLTLDWAIGMSQQAGPNYNVEVAGTTTDSDGNVYSCINHRNSIDMDPGSGVSLTNTNYNDADNFFIQKLGPTGNLVWAKSFGPSGDGQSIFVDNQQNVYISGSFENEIDFDPGSGTHYVSASMFGSTDGFILKLSPTGDFLWVIPFSSNSYDAMPELTLHPSGDLVATGNFNSDLIITATGGSDTLTANGGTDAYVLKIQADGDLVWSKIIDASFMCSPADITIDVDTNVLVSGVFEYETDFDPGSGTQLINSQGVNAFVVKLTGTGDFAWVRTMGDSGSTYTRNIRTDQDGNVLICGQFTGTTDIAAAPVGTSFTSNGAEDAYIEKLSPNGDFIWAKAFGGTGSDYCFALETDMYGSVYAVGKFEQTVDFDPGVGIDQRVSNGGTDCYTLRFDEAGNFLWVSTTGGSHDDLSQNITVRDSVLVVSGSYLSTNFDADPSSGSTILPLIGSIGVGAFISRFGVDVCADFGLVYDTAHALSCGDSIGFAAVHTVNGLGVVSYSWNTAPVTLDSLAQFDAPGFYTITATDGQGCVKSSSLLIGGPEGQQSFDLEANLLAGTFRPGFTAYTWLNAINKSCEPVSGQLALVISPLLIYDSAVPPPTSVSGDTLFWDFTDMVFDSAHLAPIVYYTVDQNVQIGDQICFWLKVNPSAGDADTSDNVRNYCFPVINGYDPNFVEVYPQGACESDDVLKNQKLTYAIHFQNTGNSEAVNIRVSDSLSSFLDVSTLRVIGSSFEVFTELVDNSIVNFYFDSILLPDSTSNEPASHGYVIFEIDPLPALADGSVITNEADIFFDFNPAVVTNTAYSTFFDVLPCSLSLGELSANGLLVYPVPVSGELFVKAEEEILTLNILDLKGHLVCTTTEPKADVSALPAGVYLVEAILKDRTVVKRFVK